MVNSNKKYRPMLCDWEKVVNKSNFNTEVEVPYSRIELIDFSENKIHLKGGKRILFDGLSETDYLKLIKKIS